MRPLLRIISRQCGVVTPVPPWRPCRSGRRVLVQSARIGGSLKPQGAEQPLPAGRTPAGWSHHDTLDRWQISGLGRNLRRYAGPFIYYHLNKTPRAVADTAEVKKRSNYSSLPRCYNFQPFAVETTLALEASSRQFLKTIGRRIARATADNREHFYLLQHLSILIQRFNAAAVFGSLRPIEALFQPWTMF